MIPHPDSRAAVIPFRCDRPPRLVGCCGCRLPGRSCGYDGGCPCGRRCAGGRGVPSGGGPFHGTGEDANDTSRGARADILEEGRRISERRGGRHLGGRALRFARGRHQQIGRGLQPEPMRKQELARCRRAAQRALQLTGVCARRLGGNAWRNRRILLERQNRLPVSVDGDIDAAGTCPEDAAGQVVETGRCAVGLYQAQPCRVGIAKVEAAGRRDSVRAARHRWLGFTGRGADGEQDGQGQLCGHFEDGTHSEHSATTVTNRASGLQRETPEATGCDGRRRS